MSRIVSLCVNSHPFPDEFRQLAHRCIDALIERISTLVFNILAALWSCLAHFFSVRHLEAALQWKILVVSANCALYLRLNRAPLFQRVLSNHTLQRICTIETRRFRRTVAIDQFEACYTSCTMNGGERRVFDQLDRDLPRGVDIFIGPRKFNTSQEIFEELLNRGMERTRCIKILASLSQTACFEPSKLMHYLFANYENNRGCGRCVKAGTGAHVYTVRLNCEGSSLRSLDFFAQWRVKTFPPVRPLFGVNTTMRIDGATGHAEIRGETCALPT